MRTLPILTIVVALVFIGSGAIGQTEKGSQQTISDSQLIKQYWAAARKQIRLDAKFRPKEACVSARKAIRFYRGRTWGYQDELRIARSPTLYPEKVPGRCGYLRWRTDQWIRDAKRHKAMRDNFLSGSAYERAKHVIYATFPDATQHRAMGVCHCETAGTYSATVVNRTSGTTGLFQVHPGNVGTVWCWKGHGCMAHTSSTNLYDPWVNAKLALYMSKGGYDWGQWASICQR